MAGMSRLRTGSQLLHTLGTETRGDRAGEPRKGVLTPQVLAAHLFALTLRTTPHSRPVGKVFSRPEERVRPPQGWRGKEGVLLPKCQRRHPSSLWAGAMWRVPLASGPHPGVTWTGVISELGRVPRDPRNIWGESWGQGPLEVG